ncbi:ABC transporter, ATP-binding protein [Cellulomonas hominis]|uniref:ABC transporter, ATP-binding protein n=1 Tax=Cellulomonas hominis TaxID=156981 RepID=A0A511FBT4_9CELL|nr:AAA family ATPase [Cellulomonas hominis]GEL46726.1 ABC transporter, ATP-binding protein [Cellulomonas hominis]
MRTARPVTLPVRRVRAHPAAPVPRGAWFADVPAVAQVLADGWELGPATVLVGENGAGKSTLVEALAVAFGMGAEGGSTGARNVTRASESPLWEHLLLERGAGASRRGFFLRAETMHGFYTYLEDNPGGGDAAFHDMSHGESFLAVVQDRMRGRGLYVLDEPESALSFTGSLALLAHLRGLVAAGAQVVLSTHSPVLAALPGAQVLEVGPWGLREQAWEDTDLVLSWRGFLGAPERYLRHLDDA